MDVMPGSFLIKCNLALTAVFVTMSIVAAVTFTSPWKTIGVVVSLGCFSVGIVAFLWGYWTAVQRSRADNISVAALYFLVDNCAPQSVARLMNSALGIQGQNRTPGSACLETSITEQALLFSISTTISQTHLLYFFR